MIRYKSPAKPPFPRESVTGTNLQVSVPHSVLHSLTFLLIIQIELI